MRNILTCFLLVCACVISAQQRFDFESATVPAQWTGSNGTVLSIDSRHVKGGSRSLKCEVQSGSRILLSLDTETASNRIVFLPLYSEKASNDTIVFKQYNAQGSQVQEGRILLNFKGWRVYHRHLYYDFGGTSWTGYKTLEMVYRPEGGGGARTVWLDDVVADASYSGLYQQRIPGPQDMLDYRAGKFVGDYTDLDYLKADLHTPPAAETATPAEQADYTKVKAAFTFGEAYINSYREVLCDALFTDSQRWYYGLFCQYLQR